MAKRIGNLAAIVTANTSSFQKGMKSASKSVHSLKVSVSEAGSFISGKLLAIGAALGVGFSVEGLKSVAEGIDKTAKAADRMGVTTEALIGLRHAANLAGMNAETFDGSMTTMMKNVGLAAVGLGRARVAFADLGLDAQKLRNQTPENQIKALADALQTVANPTDRARIAMQIFGESGAQMINVLSEGSQGLEAMQVEADKLGLTFNRIDAAKVEAANDSLSRLHEMFQGIAQTLVIQLAPYIDAAAASLVEWGSSGEGMGQKVVDAVHFVVKGVAYLSDILDLGKIAWYGLRAVAITALQFMLKGVLELAKGVDWLIDKLSFALPDGWSKGVSEMTADLGFFVDGLGEAADEASKNIQDILVSKSASEKVDEFFKDVNKKANDAAKVIADKAPKPEAYSKSLFESLKKGTEEAVDKVGKTEVGQLAKINFSGNDLIRAGSAEAQGLSAKTFADALTKTFQKQIDIDKENSKTLKEIATNTGNAADSSELADINY